MEYLRMHFLDASAIVKLLLYPDIKEDGSDALNEYRKRNTGFYTNWLCLAEALTVLKYKRNRREITNDGYIIVASRLKSMVQHKTIKVINPEGEYFQFIDEAARIVRTYRIDLSDAFQIATVKQGIYSSFVDESKTLFITADNDLAKAARIEGLSVWDIINDPLPM